MISPAEIRELFEHDYWARDRQLQACAALTPEQLLKPLGSSFSSVRDTLAHLVAVEALWLARWRGSSPRSLEPPEDFPSLAAIEGRWKAVEADMRIFLSELDEAALQRPLTYVNLRGQEYTYPLWRMIMHLLLHQSFHRGQVTTMLRQLGAEPAKVDFLLAVDAGWR